MRAREHWLVGCWIMCSLVGAASHAGAEEISGDVESTAAERVSAAGVVNLNTASAEELDRLPGIGPSRARAILELRERLKRFGRVEDLMRVKGIGRATFRKLRPLLTLEGPTTLR